MERPTENNLRKTLVMMEIEIGPVEGGIELGLADGEPKIDVPRLKKESDSTTQANMRFKRYTP